MSEYTISPQEVEQFGRVAVIYGGLSSERTISLKSGSAVLAGLQRAGVNAFGIDLGGEDGQEYPFIQLADAEFDRAFLILHGPGGEDGTLQGALELLGKPYTGSGVAASALGMDKVRCKQLWAGAGLPTPDYVIMNEATDPEQVGAQLGWPVFVKPAHEGSSIGITKAENVASLRAAYQAAAALDQTEIIVDVPDADGDLGRRLADNGFAVTFSTARMYRGPAPLAGPTQQAIATMELG